MGCIILLHTCQLTRLDIFSTIRRCSVRVGGPYLVGVDSTQMVSRSGGLNIHTYIHTVYSCACKLTFQATLVHACREMGKSHTLATCFLVPINTRQPLYISRVLPTLVGGGYLQPPLRAN